MFTGVFTSYTISNNKLQPRHIKCNDSTKEDDVKSCVWSIVQCKNQQYTFTL